MNNYNKSDEIYIIFNIKFFYLFLVKPKLVPVFYCQIKNIKKFFIYLITIFQFGIKLFILSFKFSLTIIFPVSGIPLNISLV